VAERVKQDFPALEVVLNGGIADLEEAEKHLQSFDGVMLGRAVYHNPYELLVEVDQRIFGDPHEVPSREDVLREYLPYVEAQLARGTRLHTITRHILGLYHGRPGGRAWRRRLGEQAVKPGAGVELLREGL
jgi:tRNA-dihydrouridine synthase A